MYMSSVPILLVLTVSSLGCGDLYRIKAHNATTPGGIPFFAMSGACLQQTVRANPYYLLTLKITVESGPVSSDTVKLSPAGHASADFQALLNELDKGTPDLGSVQTAWSFLKQRQSFDPHTETAGEFILSNSSKVVPIVDYAHEYDINSRKPLSGSASSSFKIGSNGTLTDAQAQVQDNTLSTILSALPLSDLIKTAAGIAAKAGAAAAQNPETAKFSLEQEERLITTTYSITSPLTAADPYCKTGPALTSTTSGASLLVADVGAKDASGKAAPKEDTSIGISGTITLPKSLLAAPSSGDKTTNAAPDGSSPAKPNNAGGTKNSSGNSSNQ